MGTNALIMETRCSQTDETLPVSNIYNFILTGFLNHFRQKILMPNNKLSNLDRKRIVDAYRKGQIVTEISLVLGIARSTINFVIIFNESVRIDSNKRGYIKPEKFNEDQQEIITSWVDDNAAIPVRTIVS
ncbi:hypothetical protein RF11_02898 [Thelohanellus kitauei]|uniref:Uncharacterized protein n=1 Tax=Thelohanellus kitauei TaxID=669202 RepID=A0A0C2J8J6_THEKT|nr:hypothetical protein RF11_02898 [Thelohanellus kitauei]